MLSCRNPFKQDPQAINYDMDTEDEWAEQNGEDLDDADKKSEDDEEDLAEMEEAKGFIVDDDYLSVSEMCISDSDIGKEDEIQADLERRKQILR